MAENEKFNQKLDDAQLDEVAGGYREEFREIRSALKLSSIRTRDYVRDKLKKEFNIDVVHWNTGDRGSAKEALAEYKDASGNPLSHDDVLNIIRSSEKYFNDDALI